MKIEAGARSSPLSRAQAAEVQALIPEVELHMHWVETSGDLDRTTSLRTLGKSDFFTRELDALLLQGSIRIAIHSAKDLPDSLPKGLCIAAFTRGIDPRDSLVMRHGDFPKQPLIATSSERREQMVRSVFPDARFIDLRGTIEERIAKLGEVDGVVIAEAALIRLKLTHLNRRILEGTTSGQGQLAIAVREEDGAMRSLFKAFDYGLRM